METTTVELSHKWMLYTQMALAALPHSPHSSRGLPHVLVQALVHVPKFPHANPELQTVTRSSKRPAGTPNDHLELETATWSSKWSPGAPSGHRQLQMTTWSSKRPPGAPDGHLDLQMATWSSKWPPGAPNGHRELQMATRSAKRPPGAPDDHLELQMGVSHLRIPGATQGLAILKWLRPVLSQEWSQGCLKKVPKP